MVRAGSVQHIETKKKIRKFILLGVVGIVVLLLLGYAFTGVFGGDSDAKETKVSSELENNIKAVGFAVSQPKNLPEGYKRTTVKIIPASQTVTGCQEVLQRFTKSSNENSNYIDMYTYSSECSYPRPDDAEGFSVGDYAGWVSDSDDNLSILYEITVKEAMVRIETDVPSDQMKKVLSEFEQFSVS